MLLQPPTSDGVNAAGVVEKMKGVAREVNNNTEKETTEIRGDVGALRVVGRVGSATMRVTFSKEGLASYRSEDETEVLLPRDESSFTLSPMGSEFEGWDNPFTEGGTISRDAEVILRMWREQRLGQYGKEKKEERSKQPLIPSRADTVTDTSLPALQIPQKNGQGGQEGRGPPKNGVTWGPVGSGGSPKAKKGDKFRCCSLM